MLGKHEIDELQGFGYLSKAAGGGGVHWKYCDNDSTGYAICRPTGSSSG